MANKTGGGNRNSKFRPSNKGNINNRKGKPNNNQKAGVGVKKRTLKPKVQDARQKLLQNKRKIADAREVLAKRAKTQDARNKINKIRQTRTGIPSTANSNVRPIGSSILQKTDRNGKISLLTNKSKAVVDMNLEIQKQLGLIQPTRSVPKKIVPKRPALTRRDAFAAKAVMNDYDYSPSLGMRGYDASLYRWNRPGLRTAASQMISSLEAKRAALENQLLNNSHWQDYELNRQRDYIDLRGLDAMDEEIPLAPIRHTISLQGSSRVSDVHSRLDTSPLLPETHGILSHPKTKVVVPAGHRIVVSNLQPTVSQDDIKELFEDIGQLLAARLVRPGVAEVIYKNLKDAQKAVDTYHNRQLDGQPMKCLLVNKRPLNNPTGPPVTKVEQGYSMFNTRF